MTQDECYRLGKITKPFGFKGQVIFFLDVDSPEDYEELDSVFVEVKGALVPYFIKEININDNKATVTFEDLTPQEAQALVGNDLYLPLDLLPKLDGNRFYYHEIIGWHVVDDEKGDIGTISYIALWTRSTTAFSIVKAKINAIRQKNKPGQKRI